MAKKQPTLLNIQIARQGSGNVDLTDLARARRLAFETNREKAEMLQSTLDAIAESGKEQLRQEPRRKTRNLKFRRTHTVRPA
jgi:hypothetical protein